MSIDFERAILLMNAAEMAAKWPKLTPIGGEAMAELEPILEAARKAGEERAKKLAEEQAKAEAQAKKEAQAKYDAELKKDEERKVYDDAHRQRPPVSPSGAPSATSTIADHNLNRRDIR